jgi:hypothetical protein
VHLAVHLAQSAVHPLPGGFPEGRSNAPTGQPFPFRSRVGLAFASLPGDSSTSGEVKGGATRRGDPGSPAVSHSRGGAMRLDPGRRFRNRSESPVQLHVAAEHRQAHDTGTSVSANALCRSGGAPVARPGSSAAARQVGRWPAAIQKPPRTRAYPARHGRLGAARPPRCQPIREPLRSAPPCDSFRPLGVGGSQEKGPGCGARFFVATTCLTFSTVRLTLRLSVQLRTPPESSQYGWLWPRRVRCGEW